MYHRNKRQDRDLRTEEQQLQSREETILAAYENLLRHNEEVRMLRHDMKKHFYALRRLAESGGPRLIRYLDDLIGEEASIRPVVHSGGVLLNALVNGSLSKAMDRGIEVQILRDQAPVSLPLSDQDLCSVVLNVMDNALEAASAPGLKGSSIHVELYTKGSFFFFSVENARTSGGYSGDVTSDGHLGLGLNIVSQIVERNGGLLQIDQEEADRYLVRVALPFAPRPQEQTV